MIRGKTLILTCIVLLFITSCKVMMPTTRFTGEDCKPGVSKQQVVAKFGKPFKESFYYESDSVLIEVVTYKESVYKDRWYDLTSTLQFRNSHLVSLEQYEEKQHDKVLQR